MSLEVELLFHKCVASSFLTIYYINFTGKCAFVQKDRQNCGTDYFIDAKRAMIWLCCIVLISIQKNNNKSLYFLDNNR